MTVKDLAEKLQLKIINESDERTPNGIYCCDLLSIVMGRAPQDCAWITVMANVNTIAVAVLADVSCIILSEGVILDDDSLKKAKGQDVWVLATDMPTFDVAKKVDQLLS